MVKPGTSAAPRLKRAAWEAQKGRMPRVVLFLGGDPVLAADLCAAGLARVECAGMESFNVERLRAGEVKFRELVSRSLELPMLSLERALVVSGAEALLKEDPEDLRALFPPEEASTVLLLLAAEPVDRPRAGRKPAPGWSEVLPSHACMVEVGLPGEDDALRWGRKAAGEAGAGLTEERLRAVARACGGDGARLRTELELEILSALSGQPRVLGGHARAEGEAALGSEVERALCERDVTGLWLAASRFRAAGGRMDTAGAGWVRAVAARAGTDPELLRQLSVLQLQWRRRVGESRVVLEGMALEVMLARTGRQT